MTQEEKIKDKLYVLFQRHQLTNLNIREAVDLAYKAVKENDFIDDVSVDHECKFYVNANWTELRCSCGKSKKPSER